MNMSFIKDFSKISGSSFVNFFIGLFSTPLITRMVSPEQYGNWALFCVYSNVLSTILLLGSDHIIVRYYYKFEDKASRSQFVCWAFRISILSVIVTCLPIIVSLCYIRPNWDWFILCILVVSVLINAFNRLSSLLLRFENKINALAITTVIQKTTFITIAIVALLYFTDYGFELLSIATLLSTCLSVIISLYCVRYLFYLDGSLMECYLPKREMLKYGLPLMLSGCAYILFQTTDKLIIGNYCSEADLGVYSSVASFLSLFAIMQGAFTTVWWPLVMKNYEASPNDKSLYIKANDIICFVLVMVGLTFILFKDLIILLLGESYRNAVVILPFIVFQPILYTISETTVVGLNFKKRSKAQLCITFFSLAFNIIVCIFLTKKIGIIGTAISVCLSYIFFMTLRTIISYYYYKIQYHFLRMYVSIFLLFSFALIQIFLPDTRLSCLLVIICYFILSIMYKDVIKSIINKLTAKWLGEKYH